MKLSALCILMSCVFLLSGSDLGAQSSSRDVSGYVALPKVFKLGEYSDPYETVRTDYKSLLDACEGDMLSAHGKLLGMMESLETFAEEKEFDLNGIKAWMHFFFKENGEIDHIGFHLKPNSKNVDLVDFGAFLKSFSKEYQFPLKTEEEFAHYSSFSFPVLQ